MVALPWHASGIVASPLRRDSTDVGRRREAAQPRFAPRALAPARERQRILHPQLHLARGAIAADTAQSVPAAADVDCFDPMANEQQANDLVGQPQPAPVVPAA